MTQYNEAAGSKEKEMKRTMEISSSKAKATPMKLGMCVVPLLWEKKAPRWLRITVRAAQFTTGAVGFYLAGKNWGSR